MLFLKARVKTASVNIIYVARNPKDVAVSFFKCVTSLKKLGNGYNGPCEFFAKLFIEGSGKFVSTFSSKSLKSQTRLWCPRIFDQR